MNDDMELCYNSKPILNYDMKTLKIKPEARLLVVQYIFLREAFTFRIQRKKILDSMVELRCGS